MNFNDFGSPAIYVSAENGRLVGKRHSFWRLFDWMFRFHVMDYENSEIDNTLLFWFTLLGILSAIFGLLLVYFRVFRKTDDALIKPAAASQNGQGVAP